MELSQILGLSFGLGIALILVIGAIIVLMKYGPEPFFKGTADIIDKIKKNKK